MMMQRPPMQVAVMGVGAMGRNPARVYCEMAGGHGQYRRSARGGEADVDVLPVRDPPQAVAKSGPKRQALGVEA